MAAITAINGRQHGAFAAALTALTSSDTLTYDPRFTNLLIVRNPTGGALTLLIDGDGGTTVNAAGLGSVSVASGYSIAIPAGEVRVVNLATIAQYLQGVVTLTGAASCIAQHFLL